MPSQPVAFGKYALLDRVNTGGMAEVFRAKAYGVEGFERIVAVKRILPGIAADHDFITMFIDEAKLAVQLNHANVAQIFDLGRVGDSYFIALEYVHGKDLRAIFDNAATHGESLPPNLVCYVVMKICEGLDYAHRKRDASGRELRLVHRDVSPQNVLVSFEGDVKLIDFGIAKAVGNVSRTGTGILRGKFGYLSPEQVAGEAVDRRSDLFGLGIVLHELLTGQRLFMGDTEFSSIEKVRSAEVLPPSKLRPELPRELDAIVMKALARDREERHQTALELHDELQQFLVEQGEPCTREQLSAYMLAQFPEDASRDLEMVGDLEGTDTIAKSALDLAANFRSRAADPRASTDDGPEPSTVQKDSRGSPDEGAQKRPATILGMPAVLPPANLNASPTPGARTVPPPPPPPRATGARAAAGSGGGGRSVPPPPPPRAGALASAAPLLPAAPPAVPPAHASQSVLRSRAEDPQVAAPRGAVPSSEPPPPPASRTRPPPPPPTRTSPSLARDLEGAGDAGVSQPSPRPAHGTLPPMPPSVGSRPEEPRASTRGSQPPAPPRVRTSPPPAPPRRSSRPPAAGPGTQPPAPPKRASQPPPSASAPEAQELGPTVTGKVMPAAPAAQSPSRTNLGVPPSPFPVPPGMANASLSSTLLGTGPSAGPRSAGAMVDMDWDDEELSTQIYDRPEGDPYDRIESGLEQRLHHELGDRPQPISGFGALRPAGTGYDPGISRELSPPRGVQVAPHAYGRADLLPSEPVASVRPAAATHTITAERTVERRNPLYAALAVAGVVLLCFIGYVFLARTEPGMVQLTTHPPDAVLLFDGQRIGRVSPFVVTGVSPHEKHTLEVHKQGYRSWAQEVQVQPGQTLQFPVSLQPGDSEHGATANQTPGGFSIETAPSGAGIVLDGRALNGQTPLRVGNLLPRSYDVRVRLDGYKEAQLRVDVRSGTDQALPRVVLTPERVRVRLASEPSGAEVALVRGAERRALGRTPVDVTLENDGDPWSVELTKSGYETFTQQLVARDGAADLSVRGVLSRQHHTERAARDGASEDDAAEQERRAERRARRESDRAARAAEASDEEAAPAEAPRAASAGAAKGASSAESGTGTLRINSRPWSQISVDGKAVGNTPQMNLALPAGNHRVTLLNPEFNLRKTLTVKIRPGQTETHIVDLQ